MLEKVDVAEKFALFDEAWSPKIVAELNDAYVKVVKLEGEFVWHHHDDEDELFWIVSGRLRMELRDGEVVFVPGEAAGEFRPVPVTTGARRGARVEIRTGLRVGQTYVSEGAFTLKSELLRGEMGEGHAH